MLENDDREWTERRKFLKVGVAGAAASTFFREGVLQPNRGCSPRCITSMKTRVRGSRVMDGG